MVFDIPSADQNAFQIPSDDQVPDTSTLGAAGRGALDALPFGDKAAAGVESAVGSGTYDKYLKELDSLLAADKDQHPIAHGTGEVAGSVAPFFIPGVGEALGAESLAGRAAVGAGIGAIQGASNSRADIASPDFAKDTAKGAAIGAVTNPAVGAVGDMLSNVLRGGVKGAVNLASDAHESGTLGTDAIPSASDAPTVADTSTPDVKAATPAEAAAISAPQSKQGFFPSKEELNAEVMAGQLGGSPRQLRAMPGKDIVQSLNHMRDTILANSTPDNQLISGTDRYADRLQKFLAWQNKSGKVIGDTIASAGVPPVSTQPLTDSLQNSLKFPNPDDAAQMKAVIDSVQKYAAMDGTPGALSFQRLQQLKSDLGAEAFQGQGKPVLQTAYHVVSDLQDGELQKASSIISKPQFDQAKDAYQTASRAIPMLRMATARSLTKGYSSFGTPLAALVTGHPVAAAGAMLKEPLMRAAGSAAFNAPGMSADVSGGAAASNITSLLSHPAMTPYRQAFQAATKGLTDPAEIQKAQTVTDFVKSQSDPAYAAAKAKASEEQ